MSRVGKKPVEIPSGVTPTVSGQDIKIKGPKGELSVRIHDDVSVKMDGSSMVFAPRANSAEAKRLYPTMRVLVKNMIEGVTKGYTRKLEIQGVGLRANVQGSTFVGQLGFSHEVRYTIPKGVTVAVENQTAVTITGIDKQLVGQVAANIRGFKPPEPYKGKGIRYAGEYVMIKEGKKK
ncbi:MAG: 50S ribosomal protein L6 [Alphaproteobacteria bacterium]|nr:50S ribosomal protein L6 [Alphaproteobacteria bacterium]